jgi:ankyrin repeat protein
MKHLLLTTIAAVVLVGCGPKAPDISIHDAAEKGNIQAVKQHIAAGTDVNAKDDALEWTPLFMAAAWGHKEVVELFIAKGADVNATDDGGKTPLDEATHPDNPNASAEIADLLRKHGGKTGEELKADGK